MKKYIIVKLQHEALHCWPGCPHEDVSFLRDPHRHMFHIRMWVEVNHSDRDIEFIRLKREVTKYLKGRYNLGSTSCEMLAEELMDFADATAVEVMEDNENGGLVINDISVQNFM